MSRRDLVRLVVLVLVLLAVTGIVALASGGGDDDDKAPAAAEVTGVITSVTTDRLALRPLEGGREMTFSIRPTDVRRLDIFHLQTHSSQGLPTRVSYERDGGTLYVTQAVDAVPTP
jgi:hypothetical protein